MTVAAGGQGDQIDIRLDARRRDRHARRRTARQDDVSRIDVANGPGPRRLKRFDGNRVRLPHVARAVDFVVQRDEHAGAARGRRRRDAKRVQQIARTVGVGLARRTLRRREHDRPIASEQQVDEKCRFFECVGAVRDDDPGQRRIFREQLVDPRCELELQLGRHARAAHSRHVLHRHSCDLFHAGHERGEAGGVERLLSAGNRAAGREQMDAWEFGRGGGWRGGSKRDGEPDDAACQRPKRLI